MNSKWTDLSLKVKLDILNALNYPGTNQSSVAEKFKISRSTVSEIKKNENDLHAKAESNASLDRKCQ